MPRTRSLSVEVGPAYNRLRLVREGMLIERKGMGGNTGANERNQALVRKVKVFSVDLSHSIVAYHEHRHPL